MTPLKFILYSIAITTLFMGTARGQMKQDSIENILKTTKDDTAKVSLLLKAFQNQKFTLPDKAFNYCRQAIEIAKRIRYSAGIANGYLALGGYYSDIKNDSPNAIKAYQLADSIYHLSNNAKSKEGIGAIQHSLGTIQLRQGNYSEAAQYFMKASRILDSLNNKTILPKTYNNLSSLYSFLKQHDKAEFYALECVKLAEETKNIPLISVGSITLASALIEQKKYKEAFPHIIKAKEVAQKRNDHYVLELAYFNLASYYSFYKKDYAQAVGNAEKALEEAKLLGNPWEEARVLDNLSGFYFYNKQFEKAKASALKALELSRSIKFQEIELGALHFLAQTEAYSGDSKSAYNHLLQSWDLKDSVFNEESQRQINYMEAIYQTEKKEKEILKLHTEKQINELTIKRRNSIILTLFVTIVLLLGISFLIYRNIKHKRAISEKLLELEKHRVKELENERLLFATQSVLKGEETERKRIARDLHDGLGGLLSGAKVAFNNMKGNVVLSDENVNAFNQALNMLDNSIAELRRVAHNTMPEALMKLGLKDTLKDFCDELGKVNPMHIDFQFYGQFERVDSNLEINSYRIIQELVNNAIKYSEAEELVVQMIQEPKRLCFIIMDNGKGFDIKDIQHSKGIGLASVQSRVDSFNGLLEINTKPEKGTEITVEFSI
jgi:signal transduction histidine kinase